MIEPLKKNAKARMEKALDALKQQFTRVRTGRASPGLLDVVRVESYGAEVPLSQIATVSIEDARTLSINPFDKKQTQAIERAIINSDLGLNPSTAGTTIRIVMPPLTEERRRDLVKVIKTETESARVAIRGARRDALQEVKDLTKAKDSPLSKDEEKRAETDIQKLTDQMIAEAEKLMATKEKEVMTL